MMAILFAGLDAAAGRGRGPSTAAPGTAPRDAIADRPAILGIINSNSPLRYDSSYVTFALNHGANPTTVFTGPISLPSRPVPTSWPTAWENPFTFSTQSASIGPRSMRRAGRTPKQSW